jgi:hypothetical protein
VCAGTVDGCLRGSPIGSITLVLTKGNTIRYYIASPFLFGKNPNCWGISRLRVLVMMTMHLWTNRAPKFTQVHLIWRKTVRHSLRTEKIEDGVSDAFISLVVGNPYY